MASRMSASGQPIHVRTLSTVMLVLVVRPDYCVFGEGDTIYQLLLVLAKGAAPPPVHRAALGPFTRRFIYPPSNTPLFDLCNRVGLSEGSPRRS